jgi:hypothetical protein
VAGIRRAAIAEGAFREIRAPFLKIYREWAPTGLDQNISFADLLWFLFLIVIAVARRRSPKQKQQHGRR